MEFLNSLRLAFLNKGGDIVSDRLNSIKSALHMHATKYPKMRPCDAVKLVYQACFGPGHLIADPQRALEHLKREYELTPSRETAPLSEPIGGGVLRVNLAALDSNGVTVNELFAAFIASTEDTWCDMNEFLESLEMLKALTEDDLFRFSSQELEEYLCKYAEAGYPMVSHSEEYRSAYEPAYRIVSDRNFKH